MQEKTNINVKDDLFDKMFRLKLLKPFNSIYKKYKELFLYLFFGGLAFILNVLLFALFSRYMDELIANILDWGITIAFAYVTNHIWVFDSAAHSLSAILKELFSFSIGRLATLLMEEVMLWVGIDLLEVNDLVVKLIAQIAVIIGNYVISKLVVFRKK